MAAFGDGSIWTHTVRGGHFVMSSIRRRLGVAGGEAVRELTPAVKPDYHRSQWGPSPCPAERGEEGGIMQSHRAAWRWQAGRISLPPLKRCPATPLS